MPPPPHTPDHDSFLQHPLVHAYVSLRAFGDLTRHLDAVIAEIRTRSAAGAQVWCAGSRKPAMIGELAAALPDRRILAADAAPARVDAVTDLAAREALPGLQARLVPPDGAPTEPASCDLIVGLYSMHCIADPAAFWRRCRRALRPGGAVLALEYIGPRHLQWTDAQRDAANRALAAIVPAAHKSHHARVDAALAEELAAAEPGVATGSDQLLATCRDAGFAITGQASAGGALLRAVLVGQIETYTPTDWEHNLTLARLFREETRLMEQGVLGDDFAMFVAEPEGAASRG